MIGLSTLINHFNWQQQVLQIRIRLGIIVEFVIYINMLMFPVSAIGSDGKHDTACIGIAKKINEFLKTKPPLFKRCKCKQLLLMAEIVFNNVSFTYPHTGIKALHNFSLEIKPGEKVMIIG